MINWAKSCTVDLSLATVRGGPFPETVTALITFLYGPREPIQTPVGWTNNFHWGLDMWPEGFGDGTGCPLLALGDGIVTQIWDDPTGFGNAIDIEYIDPSDGQLYTIRYLHMNVPPFVAIGDTVRSGQMVGITGATGMATGAHLHMEVRTGNRYYIQDPLLFLQDCLDIGEPIPVPPPTPVPPAVEKGTKELLVEKLDEMRKLVDSLP